MDYWVLWFVIPPGACAAVANLEMYRPSTALAQPLMTSLQRFRCWLQTGVNSSPAVDVVIANQPDLDHVSAFKVPYLGALLPTTLLNGIGNITKTYLKDGKLTKTLPEVKDMRPPTDIIFERGKKYLLRVINTAYDATFLFTIDNHLLTVVAADFVPISPYTAKSITVGIGQRYDIIVEANPLTVEPNTELTAQGHPEKNGSNPVQPDGNYWIRTYMIDECFGSTLPGNNYEEVGIVRYDHANKNTNALSSPWPGMDTKTCQGEMGWKPWFPWVIGANPVNPDRDRHDVHGFIPETDKTPYPLARFSLQSDPLGFAPLRLNYSNITFGNLENTGGWPEPWVVVEENGTVNDWVRLICFPHFIIQLTYDM